MSLSSTNPARSGPDLDRVLFVTAAWTLAVLWILPLAYAVWTAFHPAIYETRFTLLAPLTLENFTKAWSQAPFARYFLNTAILVSSILAVQLVVCTLAAFALSLPSVCPIWPRALRSSCCARPI